MTTAARRGAALLSARPDVRRARRCFHLVGEDFHAFVALLVQARRRVATGTVLRHHLSRNQFNLIIRAVTGESGQDNHQRIIQRRSIRRNSWVAD